MGRFTLGRVVMGLWLIASPTVALEPPFDLGDGNGLTVTADAAARTVTVTLMNDSALQEAVTLGNAGVNQDDIARYKFCSTCSPAYFVPVYDLTSTYGATTGIIVWQGGWWNLTVLPLSVAGVGGPDKRGVYWLTDTATLNGKTTTDRYWFDYGFLKAR